VLADPDPERSKSLVSMIRPGHSVLTEPIGSVSDFYASSVLRNQGSIGSFQK
jgi:hypothetical protein